MWNVNPKMMCRQHLLGEHLEMHMFASNIRDGKGLKGYVDNGIVEVHNIVKRHDALAREMKLRGYRHRSPVIKPRLWKAGKVDVKNSIRVLRERCKACRKLLKGI